MKLKYLIDLCLSIIFGVMPLPLLAQVVNISSGLNLVANGSIVLVIGDGGIKNDGVFIPANSTVYFDGGSTTAISGSQPVNFYNATFRGTGNKVNNGNVAVIGTLAV